MKPSRIGMVVLSLVALAMVNISAAQNSPGDYLNAHNFAHAQVDVGPLTWNNRVSAYAQNYANQISTTCALQHSSGPYCENIAWASDSLLTATGAVNLWVNERQHYNSNTCAAGQVCGHYTQVVWRNSVRLGCATITITPTPVSQAKSGHYTQVVWRNSVRLGCARVVCRTGGTFIICNYGNYVGQEPY